MKQFIANRHTTPGTPSLEQVPTEKIPIYDTRADAEADLANLTEGQIVGTKDASNDYESELYNYVDAKLQTTEVDVPISGVSLTCKARKSGNTVTVEFIATGSDLVVPYTSTTAIGTLPEGYRPARLEEFDISGRVVASSGDVGGYPPRVTFQTNGTISIRDWNSTEDVRINSPYNSYTFLVDSTNSNFMSVNTLKDAKDYTDARAVRKFDYTMTGTDNVYNDIKALCGQLVTMGVNTYAGSFLRTGRTHGHYNITVSQASTVITLNGTVVIDNEQGRINSYAVSRVNNVWCIMPTMLNNNIHATDCNLIINPGIYNIDTSTANTPYAGCYGIIEVKGFNPDVPSGDSQWIYQEVLDTAGKKFVRRCINPNTLSPISSQWTRWEEEDVIRKDLIIKVAEGTTLNNIDECLRYQLIHADWTFLTSQSFGTTATGQFELSGYYWGNYVATYHGNNFVTVTGTIDYSGFPYTFSAFHDASTPVWKIALSGPTIDISNTIVTLDANSCFYMGHLGVPDGRSEVIAVHAWTTDGQGQVNGDYLCIPGQNVYNQWYCHVQGWGGGNLASGTQVWIWVRYRLV